MSSEFASIHHIYAECHIICDILEIATVSLVVSSILETSRLLCLKNSRRYVPNNWNFDECVYFMYEWKAFSYHCKSPTLYQTSRLLLEHDFKVVRRVLLVYSAWTTSTQHDWTLIFFPILFSEQVPIQYSPNGQLACVHWGTLPKLVPIWSVFVVHLALTRYTFQFRMRGIRPEGALVSFSDKLKYFRTKK